MFEARNFGSGNVDKKGLTEPETSTFAGCIPNEGVTAIELHAIELLVFIRWAKQICLLVSPNNKYRGSDKR